MAWGQAHGPDLVFQGVGQGADPLNAMDENEGNTLRIWNFGGDPELAHERSTFHGHSGYNAYAVDIGTEDDANTSEFESMPTHRSGQEPPGGHLADHNVNHESHVSHLNTNDANLNIYARVCFCDGSRNFNPREEDPFVMEEIVPESPSLCPSTTPWLF